MVSKKARVKKVKIKGQTWFRVLGHNGEDYGRCTNPRSAEVMRRAVGRKQRRGRKSLFG
jgi:hypothetical protein